MKKIVIASLALLLALATSSASALTYFLNRSIGNGSVTGYVETDGTLGLLSGANILGWEITLTAPNLAGGSPHTFDSGTQLQTPIGGVATSASATELLFDTGNLDEVAYFILQTTSNGNYYCINNVSGSCSSDPSAEAIARDAITGLTTERTVHGGVIAFATVAAAVPEPETYALYLAGLGLIAGISRRGRKLVSASGS